MTAILSVSKVFFKMGKYCKFQRLEISQADKVVIICSLHCRVHIPVRAWAFMLFIITIYIYVILNKNNKYPG